MTRLASDPAPAPAPAAVALPIWARLAVAPAVALVLLVGLVIIAREAADTLTMTVVLGGVWTAVVLVGVELAGRRRPALRRTMRATLALTLVAVAVAGGWTTFRDRTVDETVAVGTPLSQVPPGTTPDGNVELSNGGFGRLVHPGSGRAAVVRLEDGSHVLTLTDLRTDAGPDLRVLLVNGPVGGTDDVDDYVDLGALKGNIGDQQYSIPAGTDLARYDTVVVWCRAFTVAFTGAPLTAS